MSYTLILNSSNLSDQVNKNVYEYKFTTGNFKLPEGSLITLSSVELPYSVQNITQQYNNYYFTLFWRFSPALDAGLGIIIPDGFYSIDDLNKFLELTFIQNGWYLIDSNGSNVYFFTLSYNTTYYRIMATFYEIPQVLPPLWTAPAGFVGFATVPGMSILFDVPNTGFSTYAGFSPGQYGGVPTAINGDMVPLGSTVNSFIVRCSLVENPVSIYSDILDSFSIGQTTYGANIQYVPPYQKWLKARAGVYSSFNISFFDQNVQTVRLLDTNLLISILIKFPDKIP
jgi:hypothetical protein